MDWKVKMILGGYRSRGAQNNNNRIDGVQSTVNSMYFYIKEVSK